jgi:hypothetical protein
LLRLEAEVLPAIGQGAEAVQRPIVEIDSGPSPAFKRPTWKVEAYRLGSILNAELERKKRIGAKGSGELMREARALAMALLCFKKPFACYTLKQYRDVAEPDKACYQSLVCVPWTLTKVLDIREIETPISVRIHEYPSEPLMKHLGLVGSLVVEAEGGVVYEMQPVRPFWMDVTIEQGLGRVVAERSGKSKSEWQNQA